MGKKKTSEIRDRVVELRRVKASQIEGAPWNWRTHPTAQRQAVLESIESIGFFDPLDVVEIAEGKYRLIDGHLRQDLILREVGPDTLVPVIVLDLSEAEEKQANLTKDPLAGMAEMDEDAFRELRAQADIEGPALRQMLGMDEPHTGEPSSDKGVALDLTSLYAVMVRVPDEHTQRQLLDQAEAAGFDASAVITGFAPSHTRQTLPPPSPGITRVVRQCQVHRSSRVRQVEGMFDLPPSQESERVWDLNLDLPAEWSVGLIIGPSGSGKSTLAREWFGEHLIEGWDWPADRAVVDGFPESMPIQEVTDLLSSVGFSSPPGWVKPYGVLSNGERFRVDMARTLAECPDLAVVDEFTSVVDRTVARIGSSAIARTVRKSGRRLVAVTCHYDVEEWLCPDWTLDMQTGKVARRLLRRPHICLSVRRVERSAWDLFRQHHYLSHEIQRNAACFVGYVNGQPAAFVAVIHSTHPTHSRWRLSRIVCLPDFQGVGIGSRLADLVAGCYAATGKGVSVVTSHPGMIAHLDRSTLWKCGRAFSTNGAHKGSELSDRVTSGARLTVTFFWRGEVYHEQAVALGIHKPNAA